MTQEDIEPPAPGDVEPDADAAVSPNALHPAALVAVIAGGVPFALSFTSSSVTVVNGVRTASSFDPIAVIGGVAALVASLVAFVFAARGAPKARTAVTLVAAVAALGLGGYHLARGLGVFADHGASDDFARSARSTSHLTPPTPALPPATEPLDTSWECGPDDFEGCKIGCDLYGNGSACGTLSAHYGGAYDPAHEDEAKVLAYAKKACDLGDPAGCGNVGVVYLEGLGVPKDRTRAAPGFAKACLGGERNRCPIAVTLEAEANDQLPSTRVDALMTAGCGGEHRALCFEVIMDWKGARGPAKVPVLKWLCEQDSGPACNEHGFILAGDEAVAPPEALKLYERSCALGERLGCLNVGIQRLLGESPDVAAAKTPLGKACAGEHAFSCHEFALQLPHDGAKRAFLDLLCEADHGPACTTVGNGIELKKGAADAAKRAQALYEKACRLKDRDGCLNRSLFHLGELGPMDAEKAWPWVLEACRLGRGAGDTCARAARSLKEHDVAAARKIADLGCDELGEAEACAVVPFMTPDGEVDSAVFEAKARKACEGKSGLGCFNLGIAFRDGVHGLARDPAKALTHFERGCELDSRYACSELAVVHAEGQLGVAADRTKARGFAERACKLGDKGWCADLEKGLLGPAPQ